MTVRELIEMLKGFPPDAYAVTRGFDECGIDDIVNLESVRIVRDVRRPYVHAGQHRLAGDGEAGVEGVLIDY